MANIHTLSDFESSQPNVSPLPNPWTSTSARSVGVGPQSSYEWDNNNDDMNESQRQWAASGGRFLRVPDIDGSEKLVPIDEFKQKPFGFLSTLCLASCCPCCLGNQQTSERKKVFLKFFVTFCVIISIVQFIMLCVALIMGGITSLKENPSIGPPATTLITLGAKDTTKIQNNYQLWRLIVPVLLHAGILHYLFNVLFQLRFGVQMEKQWGLLRFVLLYIVSAIGGNLMSCLLRPNDIGVGASTALCGLLAGALAHLCMTWHKHQPSARKMMLIQLIIVISMIMLFSFLGSQYIDAAGHFGGLVVGGLMGCVYFAQEHQTWLIKTIGFYMSILCLCLYFIISILLLFFYI